jgi:TonB family protein
MPQLNQKLFRSDSRRTRRKQSLTLDAASVSRSICDNITPTQMPNVVSPLKAANASAAKHSSTRIHFAPACVVIAAHVALISLLMRQGVDRPTLEMSIEPMLVEVIPGTPSAMPEATSLPVPIAMPIALTPPMLPVESQAQTVTIDAPEIDPATAIDAAPYAARAELAPGTVATVILLLEIAPDGSVLSAQVVRSTSGDAANSAALDYARATRWTAGMIDGEPRAMQASLTVILGERS